MILRPGQFISVQRCRLKAQIGIPGKGQRRRAGRISVRRIGKHPKPVVRQSGQIRADPHQFLQVVHAQVARRAGQPRRIILKRRDGHIDIAFRPVQPLGRRNYHQHEYPPFECGSLTGLA